MHLPSLAVDRTRVSRALLRVIGVALLLAAGGCKNPCQRICVRMADYATEECKFQVSDTEVDACVDAMADSTGDDKATCRDYGDAETIRNEWACEDLAVYFDGEPAGQEESE